MTLPIFAAYLFCAFTAVLLIESQLTAYHLIYHDRHHLIFSDILGNFKISLIHLILLIADFNQI